VATSTALANDHGGFVAPIELAPTSTRWTFTPTNTDGTAGTPITGGWDIATNKPE
jgi:hypothetical protein